MKLITKLDQLIQNIDTVERCLTEGSEDEQSHVANLIRRGSCMMAYKVGKEIRFAPSRFIGYVNNTLDKHSRSHKDGRETNIAINGILKSRPLENEKLKAKYLSYCKSLGFTADDKNHKFWLMNLEKDFETNNELTGEFPEGKIVERTHKARERNSQVVQLAKANFKKKHGRLYCEICKFDFETYYGNVGKDFIEGHHTIAVSEMTADHKTKPEDIAMLCSNCHKMVHKKRPWLTMDKLQTLMRKKNGSR